MKGPRRGHPALSELREAGCPLLRLVEVKTAKDAKSAKALGCDSIVWTVRHTHSGTKLTWPPFCPKFLGDLDFLAALAILYVQ